MPDRTPPHQPDTPPSTRQAPTPLAARLAALDAVATALRRFGLILAGAAGAEATHGRSGVATVLLLGAMAVWYSGVVIGDRQVSA